MTAELVGQFKQGRMRPLQIVSRRLPGCHSNRRDHKILTILRSEEPSAAVASHHRHVQAVMKGTTVTRLSSR